MDYQRKVVWIHLEYCKNDAKYSANNLAYLLPFVAGLGAGGGS